MNAAASKPARKRKTTSPQMSKRWIEFALLAAAIAGAITAVVTSHYTVSFRSPLRIRLQWPVVFAPRTSPEVSGEAQADQFGHRLTAYQQYACNKFGSACRIALAVQRAENPRGDCEICHYNT